MDKGVKKMVEIEARCAELLRQLRKKRGMTLRECEEESGGRFKAVVMGSYERGTRAISLERLQEIADFYHVPIQYFMSDSNPSSNDLNEKVTFDLRKMKLASAFDPSIERLTKMLSIFISKRSDWNGELLTIRRSDNELLEVISNDADIVAKLRLHQIFFKKER
jgi:transcriptional regulator with XRE-family HTH domain